MKELQVSTLATLILVMNDGALQKGETTQEGEDQEVIDITEIEALEREDIPALALEKEEEEATEEVREDMAAETVAEIVVLDQKKGIITTDPRTDQDRKKEDNTDQSQFHSSSDAMFHSYNIST